MTTRLLFLTILASVPLVATDAMAGAPGARVGDMHVCPMVTGIVPHVGGPVVQGAGTVLICGKPAARTGDPAACTGPHDSIVQGSATVLIGGKPAARVGSTTAHGGRITQGCPSVIIGG